LNAGHSLPYNQNAEGNCHLELEKRTRFEMKRRNTKASHKAVILKLPSSSVPLQSFSRNNEVQQTFQIYKFDESLYKFMHENFIENRNCPALDIMLIITLYNTWKQTQRIMQALSIDSVQPYESAFSRTLQITDSNKPAWASKTFAQVEKDGTTPVIYYANKKVFNLEYVGNAKGDFYTLFVLESISDDINEEIHCIDHENTDGIVLSGGENFDGNRVDDISHSYPAKADLRKNNQPNIHEQNRSIPARKRSWNDRDDSDVNISVDHSPPNHCFRTKRQLRYFNDTRSSHSNHVDVGLDNSNSDRMNSNPDRVNSNSNRVNSNSDRVNSNSNKVNSNSDTVNSNLNGLFEERNKSNWFSLQSPTFKSIWSKFKLPKQPPTTLSVDKHVITLKCMRMPGVPFNHHQSPHILYKEIAEGGVRGDIHFFQFKRADIFPMTFDLDFTFNKGETDIVEFKALLPIFLHCLKCIWDVPFGLFVTENQRKVVKPHLQSDGIAVEGYHGFRIVATINVDKELMRKVASFISWQCHRILDKKYRHILPLSLNWYQIFDPLGCISPDWRLPTASKVKNCKKHKGWDFDCTDCKTYTDAKYYPIGVYSETGALIHDSTACNTPAGLFNFIKACDVSIKNRQLTRSKIDFMKADLDKLITDERTWEMKYGKPNTTTSSNAATTTAADIIDIPIHSASSSFSNTSASSSTSTNLSTASPLRTQDTIQYHNDSLEIQNSPYFSNFIEELEQQAGTMKGPLQEEDIDIVGEGEGEGEEDEYEEPKSRKHNKFPDAERPQNIAFNHNVSDSMYRNK